MKRCRIRFDQSQVVCGSTLRHELNYFLEEEWLFYDEEACCPLNGLLLCKVISVPTQPSASIPFRSNIAERVWKEKERHIFETQEISENQFAILVAACRYSELSYAGGFFDPVTQVTNPPLKKGTIIHNLGAMNIAGHINYTYGTEPPIKLQVMGTIIRRSGDVFTLSKSPYSQLHASGVLPARRECVDVLVLGAGMETGKTTCARSLAQGLRRAGHKVTFEKKTGGPFCRDWINVCRADEGDFGEFGSRFETSLFDVPGGDFLDAAGVASSHSVLDLDSFTADSVAYTSYLKSRFQPDCHIMEIAGNILQLPNIAILNRLGCEESINIIIFCAPKCFDIVYHTVTFLQRLFKGREPMFVLSGPLANETGPELLRSEVAHRLNLPLVRSAVRLSNGQYKPDNNDLAQKVLEMIVQRGT